LEKHSLPKSIALCFQYPEVANSLPHLLLAARTQLDDEVLHTGAAEAYATYIVTPTAIGSEG
jgi:hypothetical protein